MAALVHDVLLIIFEKWIQTSDNRRALQRYIGNSLMQKNLVNKAMRNSYFEKMLASIPKIVVYGVDYDIDWSSVVTLPVTSHRHHWITITITKWNGPGTQNSAPETSCFTNTLVKCYCKCPEVLEYNANALVKKKCVLKHNDYSTHRDDNGLTFELIRNGFHSELPSH